MKNHIQSGSSLTREDEFVKGAIEKRRTKGPSGRRKIDAIVGLIHRKGGISDEHLAKYDRGREKSPA